MFSKIFHKHSSDRKKSKSYLDPRVISHYGIPTTASRLAYDPIQELLAVGTMDGRIKVIGCDTIEGLLTSPKEIPFKNLEFLQNQGFLISISNENVVQVWDLQHRCIATTWQWESNITAFAVIPETTFMYLGDECGLVSVLKYDIEQRKLLHQPYSIPVHSVSEAAGITTVNHHSVVAILPQPCSRGNRVLFAYCNGVIVLWDVTKDKLLLVRGYNSSADTVSIEQMDKKSDDKQEDIQIISLCWASLDGSILAAGYTDGDIILWNLSGGATSEDKKTGKLADNVVKLQLPLLNRRVFSFFNATTNKRDPVVGLHWSASGLGSLDCGQGGHLFVYGGDEIGSAQVLTILSLEWSPQKEALKNVVRVNINLQGAFLDMILLHNYSMLESAEAGSIFVLSSPGHLQFYDSSCLSGLISQKDKASPIPIHYRTAIPTTEPYLTTGKFISVHGDTKGSMLFSEATTAGLQGGYQLSDKISKWPLNGGVPCHTTRPGERNIERLYIAGYQDGSVRIWDVTYPLLSPLLTIDPEVRRVTVAGVSTPVSALDFSSEAQFMAVGSDSGLVRLYSLSESNEIVLHVVTEAKSEVCNQDQEKGTPLSAVFNLSASPVSTLRYTNLGAKLAVGYGSGQVAMLNINPSTVLFLIDTLPSLSSAIISFASGIFQDTCDLTTTIDKSEDSESHGHGEPAKEFTFALRSDLHVAVLDSSNGNAISSFSLNHNKESTAISLYILDGAKYVIDVSEAKYMHFLPQKEEEKLKPAQINDQYERSWDGINRSTNLGKSSVDLQILLCCTDVIQLYSLKSVIQGNADCIQEVNLLKASFWTAIFKRNERDSGLIVVHQTGSVELRCLPNLELLGELCLASILRWSFKANMDKSMSSTENGQITLVNGPEFAIVSLLGHENDFRIPQSLPCLHDKTLAAALDMNFSSTQTKENHSRMLGGIVGGLTTGKESESTEPEGNQNSIHSSLDRIFSRSPASKVATDVIELNIDDITIEEPLHISAMDKKNKAEKKDKKNERKKLFSGGNETSETKPRQRTVHEIRAQYRKDDSGATSAHSAALEARNKLLERQEKLERLTLNSEELSNEAQDFASLAKELKKKMEKRRWWQR